MAIYVETFLCISHYIFLKWLIKSKQIRSLKTFHILLKNNLGGKIFKYHANSCLHIIIYLKNMQCTRLF